MKALLNWVVFYPILILTVILVIVIDEVLSLLQCCRWRIQKMFKRE
jgi:hypothetical protein